MTLKMLLYFIHERELIRIRRESGEEKPWSKDLIFQRYKFTNIMREHDRVSRWVRTQWFNPNANRPDLFFASCIRVLVNWPDTLEELGFPIPWNPDRFMRILEGRRKQHKQTYSGAYIIHSIGKPKSHYLARKVFTPIWENRKALRPKEGDTLESFYNRLHACNEMGSFIAGQVVADMKYVEPLYSAADWWTWAISGPGSRKGMNIVMNRPLREPWKESEWKACLDKVVLAVNKKMKEWGCAKLHAQDVQNCLCEFSKYYKTKMGLGRPRSTYPGLPESGRLF